MIYTSVHHSSAWDRTARPPHNSSAGPGSRRPRGARHRSSIRRGIAARIALRSTFILCSARRSSRLYYPQPYLGQILRKLPITSSTTTQRTQPHNHPDLRRQRGRCGVALRADALAEARPALDRRKAFAMVGVLPGTSATSSRASPPIFPIYADAAYLFIVRSTGAGIVTAVNGLPPTRRRRRARRRQLFGASLAAQSPADVLLQPLRPSQRLRRLRRAGGLRAHPAADPADRRRDADRVTLAQARSSPFASVLRHGIARLTVSCPRSRIYFIVSPRVYRFSTLEDPLQLLTLASVFILETSFMRQGHRRPGSEVQRHRP